MGSETNRNKINVWELLWKITGEFDCSCSLTVILPQRRRRMRTMKQENGKDKFNDSLSQCRRKSHQKYVMQEWRTAQAEADSCVAVTAATAVLSEN